jgi:hypothetical protein
VECSDSAATGETIRFVEDVQRDIAVLERVLVIFVHQPERVRYKVDLGCEQAMRVSARCAPL